MFRARGNTRHCGRVDCKLALQAAHRPRTKEQRERKRAYDALRYALNAEVVCAKTRERRRTDDSVKLNARAYYAANRVRINAKAAQRRASSASVRQGYRDRYASDPAPFIARSAARRALTGGVTTAEVRAVLASCDGRCAYCFALAPLELDHIVPLASGGMHVASNLAPACRRCNRSKRATALSVWLGVRLPASGRSR